MAGTLVIVPCGRSKIWDTQPDIGAARACDAYTGTPFRLNRTYAEQFGDAWVILERQVRPDSPGLHDPWSL